MIQIRSVDGKIAGPERVLPHFVEIHARAEIRKSHRKVRVLHLARERFLEPRFHARGAINLQLCAGQERREEEGKSLDVVPVNMAEEEMRSEAAGFSCLRRAKPPRACSTVEYRQTAVRTDLYTGGVPTIPNGRGTRRRHRSPRPPKTHLHYGLTPSG